MVGMGDLPDGIFHSGAYGVSADGLVIVGKGTSDSGQEAFRWEAGQMNCEEGQMSLAAGQMTGLGDFPGGDFGSGAWDVSGDGTVIVGEGTSGAPSPGAQAYRREGEVMTALGNLQERSIPSRAKGISNDGSVVVGSWTVPTNRQEAFRWEGGGEMTGLGDLGQLPDNSRWSRAWAASDDGSVIVGESTSPAGSQAFRWEGGEMIGLGDLPEGAFSSAAFGVSGDGSIIVGTGSTAASDRPRNEAFIWNSVNGMLGLQNVLEDHMGLDLPGWTLTAAQDISYHSRVITGYGTNPDGNREAWLVLSWEQLVVPPGSCAAFCQLVPISAAGCCASSFAGQSQSWP